MSTDTTGSTTFWYTYVEGYRSRVSKIPRNHNWHYNKKYPHLCKRYYEEWYRGWDQADTDLKNK